MAVARAGSGALPIARRLNLALSALVLALAVYAYLLAPLMIAWHAAWAFGLVTVVLATPPLWALLHEAIHGTLHPERRVNDCLGRALAIAFGAPFGALRTGHLLHHRCNRGPLDRPEMYDPATTPRWRAQLAFYFRLLIGLYLAELAAGALVWLPRVWLLRWLRRALRPLPGPARAWTRRALLAPRRLAALRLEGLTALGALALAAWLYGPHWPLLVAMLLGRGLVVSLLDNVFHYGTALAERRHALNLSLPMPLARALLHFNLHGVHHRYPALPWTALPAAFAASRAHYDGTLVRGVLRQLAGPIADPSVRGA